MTEANTSTSSNLDMKALKRQVMIQVAKIKSNDTVSIEGLPINISMDATNELFIKLFSKGEKVIRIASGLTIAKGFNSISATEIKQALEIEERGIDNYLPQIDW